jgi:hypothetical protein
VSLRTFLRCRVLHKHRWIPREGPGDENYWECRDCHVTFAGAPETGEGKYRMPSPLIGPYRDQ